MRARPRDRATVNAPSEKENPPAHRQDCESNCRPPADVIELLLDVQVSFSAAGHSGRRLSCLSDIMSFQGQTQNLEGKWECSSPQQNLILLFILSKQGGNLNGFGFAANAAPLAGGKTERFSLSCLLSLIFCENAVSLPSFISRNFPRHLNCPRRHKVTHPT